MKASELIAALAALIPIEGDVEVATMDYECGGADTIDSVGVGDASDFNPGRTSSTLGARFIVIG